MNLTITKLPIYKSVSNTKNMSFKNNVRHHNAHDEFVISSSENNLFYYDYELDNHKTNSFLNYITQEKGTYYSKTKTSIINRIIDNYDAEILDAVYKKMNNTPEDKIDAMYFVLSEVNNRLTQVNKSDTEGLSKILNVTRENFKSEYQEAVLNIKDGLGNSIFANSIYQKDDVVLKNILNTLDDDAIVKLLTQKNLYAEYPIGKTGTLFKNRYLTRIVSSNDKIKKSTIPTENINIVRKKVLELIKNDYNDISRDKKMQLCYIYAPREHEKRDVIYNKYQRIIKNFASGFEEAQ